MRLSPLVTLVVFATALGAQAPERALTSSDITATDMRRRIEIIADDSMEGRGTPGPGLERAARYVEREFSRLGLRPAGDGGGYVQRWGLSRLAADPEASRIEIIGNGLRIPIRLGVDARLIGGAVDGRLIDAAVSGPGDPRRTGRVVVLPVDYSRPLSPDLQQHVDEVAATAAAVIILSNRDSASFALRLETAARPPLTPDFRRARAGAPVVEIHRRALASAAGDDFDRALIQLVPRYHSRATAPNLVGILEGRDPALRGEFVAISAHIDAVGIRPGAADSILNGADDNASGVAALLEIAELLSPPEARPRRSVLFLVPSGEEPGLWGSDFFVSHPTVPLDRIVADLNMDLIGRNWSDSVIVVGPELSSLGETLRAVERAHPKLRMGSIADRWPEERIFYRSDHYHFARRGVPVLFFTSGTHPDYHQPTDTPDRLDPEKASRVARLVHRVAAAVADAAERPRWLPEGSRRIAEEK